MLGRRFEKEGGGLLMRVYLDNNVLVCPKMEVLLIVLYVKVFKIHKRFVGPY